MIEVTNSLKSCYWNRLHSPSREFCRLRDSLIKASILVYLFIFGFPTAIRFQFALSPSSSSFLSLQTFYHVNKHTNEFSNIYLCAVITFLIPTTNSFFVLFVIRAHIQLLLFIWNVRIRRVLSMQSQFPLQITRHVNKWIA